MAKIQIKSDKLIAFGVKFQIMEKFDSKTYFREISATTDIKNITCCGF